MEPETPTDPNTNYVGIVRLKNGMRLQISVMTSDTQTVETEEFSIDDSHFEGFDEDKAVRTMILRAFLGYAALRDFQNATDGKNLDPTGLSRFRIFTGDKFGYVLHNESNCCATMDVESLARVSA